MNPNFKYRVIAIVAVILVCIYGIIGIPTSKAEVVENWKKNIKLGTDLKGGSQLILQVQLQDAFKGEADTTMGRLRDALNQKGVEFTEMTRNDPQAIADADKIQITIKGVPSLKSGDFRNVINDTVGGVWITATSTPPTIASR
jgi:preprotein translocase subunit SecD